MSGRNVREGEEVCVGGEGKKQNKFISKPVKT